MKKIIPSDKEQAKLLILAIQSIFGINAKIDFSRWNHEPPKIVIKDIDWDDDMLMVLKRLREYFWIDVEAGRDGNHNILILELLIQDEKSLGTI